MCFRIIVAGGSLDGLFAATLLHRAGFDSVGSMARCAVVGPEPGLAYVG